ncbi:MAG TPA: rod shape-determining protein MreC [Terriglobales bacterium]|nr:rod shape-determining protein MreC [Terriglobales bacterium]
MKNRNRTLAILLAIAIMLLIGMYTASQSGEAGPIQNAVGVVLTPLQKGLTSAARFVSERLAYFTEYKELKAEKETLEARVLELEGQLVELERYREENKSLREFSGVVEKNREFEYELAQVIARDPENLFYTFTIDKGSSDGIERYDAVTTPDGLAGIVTEVGTTYAKVTSIIDEVSPIGAVISRTLDVAVLEDDAELGAEGYCRLSYLPGESSAAPGDVVLTSGLGDMFPAGIVIGRVLEVRQESHNISSYAVVEPAVDFSNIHYVMVIKSFDAVPVDTEASDAD